MKEGNQSKKGKIRKRYNLIMQIPYPMKDQLFLFQSIEF